MAVEDRLDFLWVNLSASYINDSVLSADKIVSVIASLNHITGVDEALIIGE